VSRSIAQGVGEATRTAVGKTAVAGLEPSQPVEEATKTALAVAGLDGSRRRDEASSRHARTLQEPPVSQARLLTVTQAATQLSVTPRHVRKLLARGRLTHMRLGRMLRIEQSELDRYLDAHRVPARQASRS
jgi:excisionase family DNA binding protein